MAGEEGSAGGHSRASGLVASAVDVVRRYAQDSMSIYAAAVAFWAIISLVPLLAMVTFGVGIFAATDTIDRFLDEVSATVPGETIRMLTEQVRRWTALSNGWSRFWLVVAVGAASWGASSGVSQLIRAINAAHRRERRSYAVRRLTALVRTVTALVLIVPIVLLIAATPAALGSEDVSPAIASVITLVRWPVALMLFTLLISGLYWVAPEQRSRFSLLTPGVSVALLTFFVVSGVYSLYSSNVDRYDESYGSLATIVVTMLWTYGVVSAILLGAEVDASRESRRPPRPDDVRVRPPTPS